MSIVKRMPKRIRIPLNFSFSCTLRFSLHGAQRHWLAPLRNAVPAFRCASVGGRCGRRVHVDVQR